MILAQALPLLAVASVGALFAALLYHVVGILASVLVSTVIRKETESGRELATFARRGLVARSVGFVAMVVGSVARLVLQTLQACLTVVYYMLPIIALSAGLALMQLRWGACMRALDLVVADDMPLIRALLLAPFAIAAQAGLFLAPLYNFAVYAIIHAPIDVLLWALSGFGAVDFAGGLLSILQACRAAVVAFAAFLEANPADCSRFLTSARSNCTGSVCVGPSAPPFAAAAFACLDPGRRSIDLSAASALAGSGAVQLVRALGGANAPLGLVLNMVAYPVTDQNTWAAVGSFANAALGTLVSLPTATIGRCDLAYAQNPASRRWYSKSRHH